MENSGTSIAPSAEAEGGADRHDAMPRRFSVPLVALAFALAGVPSAAFGSPTSLQLGLAGVLGIALLTLSIIDIETMRLPDVITLPLIACGVFSAPWLGWSAIESTMAASVAGAGLFAIAYGYERLRSREGLGLGDVKLFAASGAWVGIEGLAPILLWSTSLALSWLLAVRLSGRQITSADELPFGPFLALGTWIVWTHASIN